MKQQIADFSKQLNLEELYLYIFEVWESTEEMLERLSYDELKRKIPKKEKEYLESLNVVNDNEKAIWLIDYWCSKDYSWADSNAVFKTLDYAHRSLFAY